ncbi:hypothetical protein STXM2123_2368 [Streptomyces sp. F-3]|nr:hypothetical protein STXM2123_2368 [Streptomyces sp. F-3]
MADGLMPLLRQLRTLRPWLRGLPPGDHSRGHVCGRLHARSFPCHPQAGRNRRGWTAPCKVTYLRGPC